MKHIYFSVCAFVFGWSNGTYSSTVIMEKEILPFYALYYNLHMCSGFLTKCVKMAITQKKYTGKKKKAYLERYEFLMEA